MTVKELIETLQKADPNKEVKIIDSEGNLDIELLTIDQDDDNVYIVFE